MITVQRLLHSARDAQFPVHRSSGHLNFVFLRLMFMGPQYETCPHVTLLPIRILWCLPTFCGLDSSVSTVTGYGLDGPGIESRWRGKIFRTCPDRPWGPPSLLYNGYRVFPGGKEWPGRDADPSPTPSAVVMKG